MDVKPSLEFKKNTKRNPLIINSYISPALLFTKAGSVRFFFLISYFARLCIFENHSFRTIFCYYSVHVAESVCQSEQVEVKRRKRGLLENKTA